ncbi:MAG TPA: DUF1269 domain-containing protein [Candidatus Saccharimonadales bacterium]|jgi:uncharacterized membrane protein
MANLFVLAFKDEDSAARALKEAESLQKQKLITVDDAAVAVHHQNGKVKIRQAKSLAGAGALGGAFWGMLFGLIFFVPFAGMALGAATGALMGKLSDYGIDDKFIQSVSNQVTPGTSALFLLAHGAQKEKVIAALKPYGGELIQSSLSPQQEEELKEALAS